MDFLSELQKRFDGAADFTARTVCAGGVDCTLCFLDGLTSGSEIADFVIRPLGLAGTETAFEGLSPEGLLEWALTGGTYAASVSRCADADGNKAKCGNKTRKIPAFFQKTIAFLLIRCYNCPVIG